jgi:hypothetical protein
MCLVYWLFVFDLCVCVFVYMLIYYACVLSHGLVSRSGSRSVVGYQRS